MCIIHLWVGLCVQNGRLQQSSFTGTRFFCFYRSCCNFKFGEEICVFCTISCQRLASNWNSVLQHSVFVFIAVNYLMFSLWIKMSCHRKSRWQQCWVLQWESQTVTCTGCQRETPRQVATLGETPSTDLMICLNNDIKGQFKALFQKVESMVTTWSLFSDTYLKLTIFRRLNQLIELTRNWFLNSGN